MSWHEDGVTTVVGLVSGELYFASPTTGGSARSCKSLVLYLQDTRDGILQLLVPLVYVYNYQVRAKHLMKDIVRLWGLIYKCVVFVQACLGCHSCQTRNC